MLPYVSSTLSPMAMIGKHIKEMDPTAKVVFIGPCTAKKMEQKKENVAPYVDTVITFEELQALLDSKDIDITKLEESKNDIPLFWNRRNRKCFPQRRKQHSLPLKWMQS